VGGNQTATINPNGTVSMTTGTPGAPVGGYTGMESLRNAYTQGGGSLGYTPYAPKTIDEFNKKFDARKSITTKINEIEVDVLKVESVKDNMDLLRMGSIVILLVVKKEDADIISPLEFRLKGHLTRSQNSGIVDHLVMESILVADEDVIIC
jgi:hypothetical protein